jgi:hypothetical protein
MLSILLDYRWWIDREEDSCESIAGRVRRAALTSPRIRCDPILNCLRLPEIRD